MLSSALPSFLGLVATAGMAVSSFGPEPAFGPCPGAALACVGSGGQSLAVAIGLPPRSLGILVGGTQAQVGPVFGNGRLCIADPRLRFGSTQADGEGTAVVRLSSRPAGWGEAYVQLLWRDPFSGQHGSSSVARLPGS